METQRTVEFPHHNLDKRPRKWPRSAWDVPDHVIPHPKIKSLLIMDPKKFVDYGSEDRISSKMGEGTFGQVLECLDNEKKEPVAIKAVRSINKYREAAMIEMDVLQTLASHDVGGSRLEVVKLKSIRSQAKVIGTLTTGLQEPCL
ncbi:putative dual-specificity kinase CMGC-CLK family [Helianthus annuus]|uniref:Dual-specificity kinase CMGC-CLK family n=1 Tax=Helianthus annuus TaxID=4232 RepID=A0A9K3HSP1_HELAN|nr:putative dual-specificity kinase CMGC-CLK family [Helianthus annuus]KAJ0503188.1 putative dual-specificity kinase CMGC-CLK family [Helianthus annuus]KAJ0519155.1 putative dual-specificity kinase CMGC-CLK family [Helianthus annuus]KAJ0690951.1 putative dual-specificity kinase CMGC-CLK family [Helianthus annuus]KAJ0872614.1 putative dual-specificity kinase CMGC-CLK family [Helianthus annuus]